MGPEKLIDWSRWPQFLISLIVDEPAFTAQREQYRSTLLVQAILTPFRSYHFDYWW